MKKAVFMILIILLIGCQSKITTFDQVIEDNQVEFDGVVYDIQSIQEISFEYDGDLLVKRTSRYNDSESISEFFYDKGLMVEEHRQSSVTNYKVFYTYDEEDRLVKIINEHKTGDLITDFEYDGKHRKIIHKDQDGLINHYNEGVVDENDNIVSFTSYDSENRVSGNVEHEYDDELLISTISIKSDGSKITSYYEYNNLGDSIFIYRVIHGDEPIMLLDFLEYEYDSKDNPIKMTRYRVQSVIEQEMIRDYWKIN